MRHQRWAIQAAAIIALGLSVVLGYLTLIYVASGEYALLPGRELALVAAVVVTATGSLMAARGRRWLPLAVGVLGAITWVIIAPL